MSIGALIEAVHPYELGGRDAVFKARIPLASFVRLTALLQSDEGDISTSLAFSIDGQGHCVVVGRFAGSVRIRCQGCAEDVTCVLDCALRCVLVRTDEAARALMPAVDVVVLADDEMPLVDLLEDDLILNLPELGCARFDECPNRPRLHYGAAEEVASSPFSALAGLLKTSG